jgi:hypothetical protein
MPEEIVMTKEILLESLASWKDYPINIEKLPPAEKSAFLEKQGYKSAQALLSHILGWWEEAFAIVDDTLAGRERAPQKYDFDIFNAESLARYEKWTEANLLSHYEAWRQKLVSLVEGLSDEQLHIRRVGSWLYAVIEDHAEEHTII